MDVAEFCERVRALRSPSALSDYVLANYARIQRALGAEVSRASGGAHDTVALDTPLASELASFLADYDREAIRFSPALGETVLARWFQKQKNDYVTQLGIRARQRRTEAEGRRRSVRAPLPQQSRLDARDPNAQAKRIARSGDPRRAAFRAATACPARDNLPASPMRPRVPLHFGTEL